MRPGGGMADTLDLGSSAERCAGSSPVPGTIFRQSFICGLRRFVARIDCYASLLSP